MKLLCINDAGRPNCIPISKWVKKNEWYTPIGTVKCNIQGGILGFKLAEIELDSSCEPYTCFAITRFAIPVELKEKEELEELELA